MGFLSAARAWLGFEQGASLPVSPWADSSHLEAVTWASLYGDVDAVRMDRSRAMQLSVVKAARRRIASTIGTLPLLMYRDGAPVDTPRLLIQPEAGRTRSTTLTWTVDTLLFHPWAHWYITDRDYDGRPTRVQLVPESKETVDEHGRLIAIGDRRIDPRDAIRFDGPDSGALIDAADALRRAWLLGQAASKAEANPVPALDLHNTGEDLTSEEISELLDSWEAARRKRGVGYSSRGLEVRTLGAHTENLLISGRRQMDLELCRHFGIPAWAADVPVEGSSLTYTNRASRNSELIDGALAPYLEAIAGRLSLDDITPRGCSVTFDTDGLVKPLRAERLTMLGQAVAAGLLTIDEARAEEGLAPLKEKAE